MASSLIANNIYVYYCGWIKPPHDKIALCICDINNWAFWFNSNPAFHKDGQLSCDQSDHYRAITKQCYLDLSGLKAISSIEIRNAGHRGPISDAFRSKIVNVLTNSPPRLLSPAHRGLALTNLL